MRPDIPSPGCAGGPGLEFQSAEAGRVIGGVRFALARARAHTAPLATLAVVSALAALLVVGVASLVAAVETREARGALAVATGDRVRLVLSFDETSAADASDAAASSLSDMGAQGALRSTEEDGSVVLTPDLGAITAAQVLALEEGLGGLRDDVEERTGERPEESGGLRDTLAGVREGIEVRRGPTSVAVGLLALLTAVVVGAVALEPVRARESETRLLRARGARRRELVLLGSVEALVVAVVGAAVGGAAAAVLAAAVVGSFPEPAVLVLAIAGVPLVAALVVAVATARSADRGSARARAVAGAGAIVLLAVITGLAVWQFVRAGTPVVERGDGEATLDPLVALAPALALVLAAIVAVAVATPLARTIATTLSRTRGVSPVTPLRLASRRPARHALSITVVAFAIGTITVAGAYQSSLTALGNAPEALRVGADVKVGTIPSDVAAADVAASGSPDAAMLARPMSAQGSDARIPILAVQSAQLGDVMLDADGTIDPAVLGEALAPTNPEAPLAGGDLTLTVTAVPDPPMELDGQAFEPGPPALQVHATVIAASGAIATLAFTNADVEVIEDDNGNTYPMTRVRPDETVTLDLPTDEQWSLAALAVAYHPSSDFPGRARIGDVSSGGTAVDLSGFRPAAGTPGAVEADGGELVFVPEAAAGEPFTRAVSGSVPPAVPAVVTADLAASMSLDVGDTIALELIKPDIEAEFDIVDVVPVLPGTATGEGMLVDLGTLGLASPFDLPPTQAWLSTDDPGAVAAAVAAEFPQTVTIVADPRSAENAAGTASAFVLAAIGAAVLAVVVLVLRRTRSRADSRELALVAAMGLGRLRASRLRAQEDLFAVAMGVIGGLAAGAITAWLIVAPLVRAAYGSVPEAYPIDLSVQPVVLTLALALTVAVFCLIVASVRTPTQVAPLLREDE